jgi:type II secretory pathway pseudopilin PulG
MLTLLLAIALMIIFAGAIVPSITFDIKRDREQEMIHRGVQYSRAIRAYYKKFQRYPAKIEDLENTNNLRFLRKRYKDPITGQDFKLVHYGEVKMALSTGIGVGGSPGSSPLNAPGGANAQALNALAATALAQSQTPQPSPATQPDPTQPNEQTPGSGNGTPPASPDRNSGPTGTPSSPFSSSQPLAGGMPIIGVASISKNNSIREFDKKKKYNEWNFIYDPAMDRGGIITTPYQPSLQQFGLQNVNGTNGTGPNGSTSGFGSSPFGSQNNSSSPASNSQPTQSPASNLPQQQQ